MRLEFGTNNRHLREELNEITDRLADDRVGEQISEIAHLATKYPHSISLVQEMIPGEPKTSRFNCCQHAFSLVNVGAVTRIMKEYGYVFPGRDFCQFLIDTQLREISIHDASDGDHVVYAGSQIEHAGKVSQRGIESKWGIAHLWQHGVYEVPWRYGSTVRFFQHISREDCATAFLEYGRRQGVVNS